MKARSRMQPAHLDEQHVAEVLLGGVVVLEDLADAEPLLRGLRALQVCAPSTTLTRCRGLGRSACLLSACVHWSPHLQSQNSRGLPHHCPYEGRGA